MTPQQQELLLTVARILRAHLKDTADHSPVGYDQIIADIRDLNLALRPFESNVAAIQPNGASPAPANEIEAAKQVFRDGPKHEDGRSKASTSYLQRKMQWTYNRAAAVIEALVAEGWVTEPDSAGRRFVLGQ